MQCQSRASSMAGEPPPQPNKRYKLDLLAVHAVVHVRARACTAGQLLGRPRELRALGSECVMSNYWQL